MTLKRMFTTQVVESDTFFALPLPARQLYFHICLHCDDDGFCDCMEMVRRLCGSTAAAVKALVDAGYLIKFLNVYAVTHFRVQNKIRKDRLHECRYPELASVIYVLPDGTYTTDPFPNCPTLLETRYYPENKNDRQMSGNSLTDGGLI